MACCEYTLLMMPCPDDPGNTLGRSAWITAFRLFTKGAGSGVMTGKPDRHRRLDNGHFLVMDKLAPV